MKNELTETQRDELRKYLADRKEWADRQAARKAEVAEYARRLLGE